MRPADPTRRELLIVAYGIVRTYLEVERGLRPPVHLAPHLIEPEYFRHRGLRPPRSLRGGGPVVPSDIVRLRLDQHRRHRAIATAITRQPQDRYGALVVHLVETRDGVWRADQVERLHRTSLTREEPSREATPDDIDRRIDRVEEEREAVAAAFLATEARLADLSGDAAGSSPEPSAADVLRSQQRTWERLGHDLDRELDTLRRTRDLRAKLTSNPERVHDQDAPEMAPEAPGRRTTAETRLTHGQLVSLLGPRPEQGHGRRGWEAVANTVQSYRERWGITEPNNVLGPQPDDPDHRRQRERIADLLRATARELQEQRHRQLGLDPEPRSAGRGQPDRGVGLGR